VDRPAQRFMTCGFTQDRSMNGVLYNGDRMTCGFTQDRSMNGVLYNGDR